MYLDAGFESRPRYGDVKAMIYCLRSRGKKWAVRQQAGSGGQQWIAVVQRVRVDRPVSTNIRRSDAEPGMSAHAESGQSEG